MGLEHGSIEQSDIDTGKSIKTFEHHKIKFIQRLSENKLASASADTTIKVWSLSTGRCLKTLYGHDDEVLCIDVLPNNRLVSFALDGNIRVWSLESGECLKSIEDQDGGGGLVKALPNQQLLSCSRDLIKLWNLSSGTLLKSFVGHRKVFCVDVLTDGRVISCATDMTIKR